MFVRPGTDTVGAERAAPLPECADVPGCCKSTLREQQAEAAKLDAAIAANLKELRYDE